MDEEQASRWAKIYLLPIFLILQKSSLIYPSNYTNYENLEDFCQLRIILSFYTFIKKREFEVVINKYYTARWIIVTDQLYLINFHKIF